MFRPDRSSRHPDPERLESSEPSLLERLRTMPGGKPLLAVIAVLGQLSLYVPRRFEMAPKSDAAMADGITTEAEAKNFIAGTLPEDVTVQVTGETVVLTDTSHPEASEYREFVFPGETVSNDFSVSMRWAGRSYERGANAAAGELALMETGVQEGVDAQLNQLGHLGVAPNDLIIDVLVVSQGLASPEGTKDGNIKASQQRAQLGLDATAAAYQQHGIAPEKIHGEAIGSGAEGTIDEFVQALNNQVYQRNPVSREQAIQLIKRIHDGEETDPALVELFQQHVAAHRRADISTFIKLADVVVRVPDVPGAVQSQTVPGLEYFASRDERRRRPGQPEDIPPLGGDPQKAFILFSLAMVRPQGEQQPTRQEVFNTILRIYTGVEQDSRLVSAYNDHIALGEEVAIDAIIQLADVVRDYQDRLAQADASSQEALSTHTGSAERLTSQAAFTQFTDTIAALAGRTSDDKLRQSEAFATLVRAYTGAEQNDRLRAAYEDMMRRQTGSALAMIIQIAEFIRRTDVSTKMTADEAMNTLPSNNVTHFPQVVLNFEGPQQPWGGQSTPGEVQPLSQKTPPPFPPQPTPYAAVRKMYDQLKPPVEPRAMHSPNKQYASGLGPTKGEAIGRAPSRQGFKRSARKHHTGKR